MNLFLFYANKFLEYNLVL